MFPLFERRFHNWLSVVKDSSFLYFIAENRMPLFLYKRRKKKTKYLQIDTVECEISHSLHLRRMCVHVLVCASHFQQKSCLDVNREDLLKEAKGKMCIDAREK